MNDRMPEGDFVPSDQVCSAISSEVCGSQASNQRGLLRVLPIALFVLLCLAIAFSLSMILEMAGHQRIGAAIMFGLSCGGLPMLAVIGGFCGRSLIRGLAISSILAASAFTFTFLGDFFRFRQGASTFANVMEPAYYAFNLPILALALVTPVSLARLKTKRYLSLSNAVAKPPFSLETLLQWTTVAACLLFFLRVPMEVFSFGISSLAVFLPGLMAICVAMSVIVVLPSAHWAFVAKQKWWHWLATAAMAGFGILFLCVLFNVLLTQWTRTALVTFGEVAIVCLTALSIYLLGLISLRASGFRWQSYTTTSDALLVDQAGRDRWISRIWTAVFIAFAIVTSLILAHRQRLMDDQDSKFVNLARSMSERGEAISGTNQGVRGGALKSLSPERIPKEILECKELISLSLNNSDVRDQDLAMLRTWPQLRSIDLSDTQVGDEVFEHLESVDKLSFLNLSRTRVTAEGLARFVAKKSSLNGMYLQGLQLTDDQFQQIYQPSIVGWDLADNRLTDSGVQAIWENDNVTLLNLARNPITVAALDPKNRKGKKLNLKAIDIPLDDATAAQLVAAGAIRSLTVGKGTQMTVAGLESTISAGVDIHLLPGGFSEEQLATISPIFSRQLFGISDDNIRGEFLLHWTSRPTSLAVISASITDREVIRWADLDWKLEHLHLEGQGLTDQCLPAIRKLDPANFSFTNTKFTAQGLYSQGPTRAILSIHATDFTPQEIRLLKQRYHQVRVLFAIPEKLND